MGDDSEWMKLPTEQKVEHKVWKARVAGYEELTKVLAVADEKSPEFTKYQGLIKKFAMDSNAISQEKGLDCVLSFIANAPMPVVARIASEVCGGIITKCLNAMRAKTKEKGMEALMLIIEAEKADIIQEELLKALGNKQPKIVIGCIQTLRMALAAFGPKTLPAKPMMKMVPKLLEDRDKNVRDETKQLVIEVYRWVGPAIKPIISNLKPVQLTELESEFDKLPGGNPKQTRFLRSQQDLKAKMEAAEEEGEDGEQDDDEDDAAAAVDMDPYDMADPVDILAKLPKDYYEKIEAKKWQERREVLEAAQKLCESIKLEKGDYHDLVKTLKKTVAKDTNVMLVAIGAKCISGLAKGLRKNFTLHASGCIDVLLEKFREKKITVVTALREAVDAVYATTNLDAISESCVEYLNHKTPTVKAETAAFLARCFTKCTPATLPKKMLKVFAPPLLKTANDTVPDVRESSYQALGTAMRVVSEKHIMPYLADVESLKMAKIKECSENAELATKSGKSGGSKPAGAAKAPAVVKKPAAAGGPPKKITGGPPKSVAVKDESDSSSSSLGGGAKGKGKKPPAKGKKGGGGMECTENVLSDEVVEEKGGELLPGDILPGLASANWKERLASMEKFTDAIKGLSSSDIPCQVCVRTIAKKPGLKENNFQVLKLKIELLGHLAQNSHFTQRSSEFCLNELVDKIGDAKNSSAVHETLSCMSEACSLEYVSSQVIAYAFEQKNPKNQSESLVWLANTIKQFGFKINVKPMIANVKKALAATNPAVRTAGMSLIGVFHIYMGPTARVFFEDEKPALLSQIDTEIEKNSGVKPGAPTRRHRAAMGGDEEEEEEEEEGEGEDEDGEGGGGGVNVADLLPRNDIRLQEVSSTKKPSSNDKPSDKITDGLIEEINDKNWKIRNEGLIKVIAIINEAKFITANIGDLSIALKTRLLKDSNKILVTTSLNICKTLATAMGPNIKKHVSVLGPGILHCLGDSKPALRATALTTFSTFVEQAGLANFIEGELLADALKVENPFLKAELFGWIAEKLPNMKKLPAELSQCVPCLYTCMEDRKPEVRQKAQEAVLAFMIHLGHDRMLKMAGKLKTGSKENAIQHLEKAKANLPAKPVKTKAAPPKAVVAPSKKPVVEEEEDEDEEEEPAKATKVEPAKAVKKPVGAGKKPVAAVAGKKKKDVGDEESGPALKINKDKERRLKDEKTLKILKWNFGTPQPEFLQQLQTQVEPNLSKTLCEQWFHADFKLHLKAFDTLIKEISGDSMESTICNIDLILKWMTLRFFDTNTTVLIKGLDYLSMMFTNLASVDYHLHDQEASCFVPYLVNKVGDPKDNVKRAIRNIFKLICKVYPASKMFLFMIEGLKSKNTKTRTECLEELGLLIEIYGITVCQPSPAAALKIIAGQISQRDNNIRTSALNTLVIAYSILGETVYKYVGRLNDKDMGMLEERIKRSGKVKSGGGVPSVPTSAKTSPDEKPKNIARVAPSQQRAPSADGRRIPKNNSRRDFVLDIEDNDNLTDNAIPQLVQHQDLDEILNEPIKMPEARVRPPSPSMKLISSTNEARSAINLVLSEIASTDIKTSIQALAQIDEVLRDEERGEALHAHVDQLIVMFSLKLRMTYSKHLTAADNSAIEASLKCYRSLLATIISLFTCKSIAKEAARDVLKDLIYHLITIMLDPRLEELEDGPQIIKSVNCTLVKVVEKSDPTNITCALLRLLHEIVGSETASTKFQELVMKCLWKICRSLPQMINDLNIDRIMAEVHLFLKAYPGPTWANRPVDTPLRTMKTIIHTVTKIRGNKVLANLTLVDTSNSELENYIKKILRNSGIDVAAKNSQNEQMNGNANTTSEEVELRGSSRKDASLKSSKANKRLSKSTHDMLAEIFKKIGSKENTREGLNDLYDFKLKFPDADLEPFLKKSSQFFQNYIERGLKNITLEREGKMKTSASEPAISQSSSSGSLSSHGGASMTTDDCNPSASVYMERLKVLRERCGLDNPENSNNTNNIPGSNNNPTEKPSFSLLGKSGGDNGSNSSLSSGSSIGAPQLSTSLSKSTSKDDTSENALIGGSVTNVADLKRRLERIKMAKK